MRPMKIQSNLQIIHVRSVLYWMPVQSVEQVALIIYAAEHKDTELTMWKYKQSLLVVTSKLF